MAHADDYITQARNAARGIWDSLNTLKSMQREWAALDYGTTLPDGTGDNAGVTAAETGSVIFATADAIETLLNTGHATNLAKLL